MPSRVTQCLDEETLSGLEKDKILEKLRYQERKLPQQQEELEVLLGNVSKSPNGLGHEELKIQFKSFNNRLHNVIICLEEAVNKDQTNVAKHLDRLKAVSDARKEFLSKQRPSVPGESQP